MDRYKKIQKIGEGASGIVSKAKVLDPSRLNRKRERKEDADDYVAIKKINLKSSSVGLSQEAVREIKILPELDHPNVVKILDIFNHQSNVNLVMELMQTDMENVIRDKSIILKAGDIKAYMQMLLDAVAHCHSRWVLHRDIKPGNLLVGKDGSIALTDFGLAKIYGSPDRKMSPGACTIWYRAPEMLYGSKSYGPAADMWSVGCVLAELMSRKPLFPGDGRELGQLAIIFAKLGTPTESDWPDAKHLPSYTAFSDNKATEWRTLFPAGSPECLDLLANLLKFDPTQRLTAKKALQHKYFSTKPAPTPLQAMPTVKNRNK